MAGAVENTDNFEKKNQAAEHSRSCMKNNPQEETDQNSSKTGGNAPTISERECKRKSLRIGNMNSDVFLRACALLDIKGTLGKDWRALAGELGYNVTQLKVFEGKSNPAESLLYDWHCKNVNNNLVGLVNALKKMENYEVIKLFQEDLNKESSCDCEDCSH